ncbi:hypothetical protein FH972_023430 [Carpinus fangiana]|uniref:Asl1-like glycosyl hydrolase catalytic domain-containing protein n=1 Tax=Carpinus fangiana TaxID=176857 RepID=A0A5N6KVS5_9ROSI|nr:hypothetical protein FH972_023430 [Carpinus fangiana]
MPSTKFSCILLTVTGLVTGAPTLTTSTVSSLALRQDNSSATLIPNGKKAGSAGGRALPFWADHLGWWYDWTPSPDSSTTGPIPVSMLWGSGNNGEEDAKRFGEFQQLTDAPQYLLGFNEPDCTGADTSANMDVGQGIDLWNQYIAPMGDKGSLLGSPSMCLQKDESWLQDFKNAGPSRDWDFTAIHVYKPDMDGVQQDIDHYWDTYQKPIWVTEFACVYDQDSFTACTDQGQINQWINDVVDLFENNEHVMGYAYTDGGGLGDAWLPTNEDGSALSESGQTYLDAISNSANDVVPFSNGDTQGCGKTHILNGVTQYRKIATGSGSRSYSIHLPINYSRYRRYPLIFGFHGSNSVGLFFEADTGLSLPTYTADKIVLYPNGIDGSWAGPSYAKTSVAEDLNFVSDVLEDVRHEFCIDSARIYATGMSNGGGFLDSLACNDTIGGEFAAFAAAAGSFYTDTKDTKNDCKPARPLTPFLEFHGLKDESVHYTGGQGEGGLEPAISDWLNWWASRNECKAPPVRKDSFGGDVHHLSWSCTTLQGNGSLQHWKIDDMSELQSPTLWLVDANGALEHVWPSKLPNFSQLAAGDTPTHVQASKLVVDFFDNFVRPE